MALVDISANVTLPDVQSWFTTLNGYASDAITHASSAASSLLTFTPIALTPSVTFDSIQTNVGLGSVQVPSTPLVPPLDRNLPSPINVGSVDINLPTAPTLDASPPSVSFMAVPSPLNITAPVQDFVLNMDYSFPITPDYTLPSVPTLQSLTIPTSQVFDLPIFDMPFPTNNLVVPGLTFNWSDTPYSDSLLTQVKNELSIRLQGGTGLSPVVEAAIWNRGRDRESKTALLAERTALVDRASQGFSRPTGAMMSLLDQITQESQSKIIDLSRDIMVKQAELEQENLKSSIQQTIALEEVLIREYNVYAQRAFEVAKYTQDVQIELYKASVSLYNTQVEAYKSFTISYQAKVQAELSKIEIFKAQIEAQKLIGDINEQSIRVYVARIEAVKTNVEIYKELIQAVAIKLETQKIQVDVFKTKIDAYSAQVAAKASEYSMYSEQVKGQMAVVGVYDSQVKAYASRVQAYASTADVTIKKADTQVEVQKLNLGKYDSDIKAYIAAVQADQLVYGAATEVYRSQAEMYSANVGMVKASAELALKQSENTITQNKYKADIAIQNANISLESVKAAYQAALQAQTNAGNIYSQIGGSALSAIHVSSAANGSINVDAQETHSFQGS